MVDSTIVLQIAIRVTVHLVNVISAIRIYAYISSCLFVFFLILGAAFSFCRRRSNCDCLSLQKNPALTTLTLKPYIDYKTIDINDDTRWSKASFDSIDMDYKSIDIDYKAIDINDAKRWTKASFASYDDFSCHKPTKDNYRMSRLGTKKVLTTTC